MVALLAIGSLVAAAPGRAANLFGLVNTGELFMSADQGASWSVVSTLPVRDAVALVAGASNADLYLGSRSGVVYRSTTGGANWTAVGAVSATDVVDLAIQPDLSVLLLTATGSLYKSADLGAHFTAIATLDAFDFVSLAVGSLQKPIVELYALTRTGVVYESTNGGITWTVKSPLTLSDAVDLRKVSNTLFVLSSTGDVYRSNSAGTSWTAIGTLSQSGMTSLTNDSTTLVAATGAGEVATSANGVVWSWRGAINQLTVTALATDFPAVAVGVGPLDTPAEFALAGPWPNPAVRGGAVSVQLALPRDELVEFTLYDVAGRQVWRRGPEALTAGTHTVTLRPVAGGAGIHFLRVTAGSTGSLVRRAVLLE